MNESVAQLRAEGDKQALIRSLCALEAECEWVEFKKDKADPQQIGTYVSALANSAVLHEQPQGYVLWGIDNRTHAIVGTCFRPWQATQGNEPLESWLARLLTPRIDFRFESLVVDGKTVVLLAIPAASQAVVRFKTDAYVRVGSTTQKLREHLGKERALWQRLNAGEEDWSAQQIDAASLDDLDPTAVSFARKQYVEKHPAQAQAAAAWETATFLNKAKVTIQGRVTRAALLLLGREEAAHFLSPATAQVSWVLQNETGRRVDYQHIGPPLLLAGQTLLGRIRNLTLRHLPSGQLFPQEIKQYNERVIREALHNCIAHQDYTQHGRINVVETPNALLFQNLGSFIPGSVESMIASDAPPAVYRNAFLATAMVNLNMIDTIGSGIREMFEQQRSKSLPMPDYDIRDGSVSVRLNGEVLDEKYTRLLLEHTELDLMDVISLDKVQRKRPLRDDEFKRLKQQALVEGRRPNLYVAAKVAAATGSRGRAQYIKNRAFDDAHYRKLVIDYLKEYGTASRKDLDRLLLDKLSEALSNEQKRRKVSNLLQAMRRDGQIRTTGRTRWAKWCLTKVP